MILAYMLSAFSYLAGIGLNVTSGWLITMASFMPPVMTLSVAVVMVRFFGIGRSVTRYLERITSHRSVFNKLAKLRSDLYRKITTRPSQILVAGSGGRVIKQVIDDIERAQEFELRIQLPGVASLIAMGGASLLAFWLQPLIGTFWLLMLVLLNLIIPKLALSEMTCKARKIETLESLYADQVRNSVHGALEAEIYGYLDELLGAVHKTEMELFLVESQLLKIIRKFQVLINLIFALSISITIYYASITSLPPVQIAMLVFLSLTGFEAVIAWYPNLFTSGKLQLARESLSEITSMESSSAALLKRKIEFDSLTAENYVAYWNTPTTIPQNFKIKRGEILVLRGPSGVGKTTTAMGILDLVRYSGSLKIAGAEIKDIGNLSELAVGALQNGHIFNTSLRENLKISGNENPDEINQVIKLLELEQLVSELPDGLDTIIGDFGRGISGGEAKRIILGRALLSNAPLLVLDEPTEHLDPKLASRITSRILEKYRDRALLVITHSGWSGVPQLNLERLIPEN